MAKEIMANIDDAQKIMPISPLLKMFGQSPIRPLQTHMAKAQCCALSLIPFFAAVFRQDWQVAQQQQTQINQLENEADTLKKNLRIHLPKNLFLPVPRSDILGMLSIQDKIANQAKDIAGIVFGRQMQFPEIIIEDYQRLLKRSLDASGQAQKAIDELDELLETGFRGSEIQIIEDMITELDNIERETDDIQITIRKHLFQLEKQLPPIDVMFLYQVIERTGSLADIAHSVGGQLQLLLAR